MVKDIAFLPTTGKTGGNNRASTSKLKIEDAMDEDDNEDDDDDDKATGKGKMREDAAGEEAGYRSRFLSCSADKTVKLWDAGVLKASAAKDAKRQTSAMPIRTYTGRIGFKYVHIISISATPLTISHSSVSHHRTDTVFATASDRIEIWDENRTESLMSMSYNSPAASRGKSKDDNAGAGDHIISVRFNQSETSMLASAGSDRTVCLYDIRTGKSTSRISLTVRANQLSWNPMQPPILLVASEDSQLYTFDVRKMTSATQVFKGHVGAVMSCDWSPTGREFVSGAYDRTVRIWEAGQGKSRDTYHTQRMQRVFTTLFTLDSRFVLSGSDDGNLRIWKARASARVGTMTSKELSKMQYRDSLRAKFKDVGDVAKIERQRFVPKAIHNATKLRREMVTASQKKEDNRRKHAPKNRPLEKPKAERKRAIAQVD